jgi:hypothetical protein
MVTETFCRAAAGLLLLAMTHVLDRERGTVCGGKWLMNNKRVLAAIVLVLLLAFLPSGGAFG